MKIGDLVPFQGRNYYIRGFDPMSVPERQAYLEDALTGEQIAVPIEELEKAGANNGSSGPRAV
jgi:hypothetical protein